MRIYTIDPEPASIGWDTIVDYLEHMRRPRMADFVRTFHDMEKRHAAERLEWQRREEEFMELVRRLQPVPYERHNPYPPPEASD